MADPQKYREHAAHLRIEASLVKDEEVRLQMLDIAGQYERLATSLEARIKESR
jgi:hypothetical protein